MEVLTAASNDREASLEGSVEAGGADNCVDGAVLPIRGYDSGCVDMVDGLVDHLNIFRCECLKISRTWREPLTQRWEVWQHVFDDLWLLDQFFSHLLIKLLPRTCVLFRAAVRDCIAALHAYFECFAVLDIRLGIFIPRLFLFLRIIEVSIKTIIPGSDKLIAKCCRDPGAATDVVIHMLDLRLEGRNDLNATASSTDDSDSLIFGGESSVPISTVKEITFKVLEAFDIGPFPFIQSTHTGHEDIANILDDFTSVELLELDMPLRGRLIPSSFDSLVLELHMLPDPIFFSDTPPVVQDFRSTCVELGPLR